MILALFGFVSLSLMDILDIFLVGVIIFLMFRWIHATPAMNIFLAIFAIYLLMLVVDALHMKMMSRLVTTLVDVGVIALVVIFQPEIRHFLMKIGSNAKGLSILGKLFGSKEGDMDSNSVNEASLTTTTLLLIITIMTQQQLHTMTQWITILESMHILLQITQ